MLAEEALRRATPREAVDALCAIALRDPSGPAARICLESGKRPSDPEECALFLLVTRQIEEYFREDYDFQNLRAAYDHADEKIQGYVMEVVRSGDRRLLGFFGSRKDLTECSEREIRVAVESGLRHQDWAKLFEAFLRMPLKYGFPLLAEFRRSSWAPAAADLKSLYRQALAESDGVKLDPPRKSDATSPVFEKWLQQGCEEQYVRLSEGELLERLKKADPPEGVKIISSLAGKGAKGAGVSQVVANSPHWLVRLAGRACGLVPLDLAMNEATDANYWVNELTNVSPLLEFWPCKATPEDRDRLNAAPREAYVGQLGTVRRVLQLLINYRVTAGEFTAVVYEAGEFAAEFEEA
jgi:hypothetical protein